MCRCGHCKKLAPDYEIVADTFANSKEVLIAKVDADQHKSLGSRFGVQGFPTLKWFPKGSTEPEEYLLNVRHVCLTFPVTRVDALLKILWTLSMRRPELVGVYQSQSRRLLSWLRITSMRSCWITLKMWLWNFTHHGMHIRIYVSWDRLWIADDNHPVSDIHTELLRLVLLRFPFSVFFFVIRCNIQYVDVI